MSDNDYVYIDPDHRLGWGYDEGSENPREWDSVTGFAKINSTSYIEVLSEFSFPGDIEEAHEHFDSAAYPKWVPGQGHQPRKRFYPAPEEIVTRWARIFYGIEVEWDSKYQGFWFVDPKRFEENWPVENNMVAILEQRKNEDGSYASGIIEVGRRPKAEQEHLIIDAERKTYNQWAEGEVYYVYAQTRMIDHVQRKDVDGAILHEFDNDHWETTDSLSGIYEEEGDRWGGSEEMLRRVAEENFGEEYSASKVSS